VNAYSTRLREAGNVPIEARVGVNTGEVVVRSISTGAGQVEYTPIGHTTNLASRMQAVAPTGSIAINEETRKFVEGYFTLKALGPTRVKGVSEPVNVYEVTGLGPLRTRLQRSAGRGLTKFVGRKREMEAMKAAAARAWAGHGQIAAAIAEPGVGKSRLFFEFKVTSQAGWMVLETFSISHGKASSYLPVIDLLHGYFKIVTEDDARTRREKITGRVLALERTLEDALPYLFGLLGLIEGDDPLTGMDAQVRRRRTLDAIKRIILRESLNQPLMVIFEDLHWIDEDTQALLNLMVESIGNARVLLLVNFRPEYSHQWGSKTYYTQVNLDPLGPQSAEDLLAGLFGTDASLLPLERLIAEKTEGNPFFMEEIVQNLFEEGTLARNGAVKITRPLSGISIPTTVQAMLAARIDRLPPATKDLLQTLAVVGREFSASLVRVIIKRSTEELDRMLNDLQLAEFIYEQPAIGDIGYIFKHALTQEVAFNSILVDRRKLIHERIGQAIEFFFATNLADHFEDLAHHYSRSDNALKAVNYLYLASDQAFRRSHYGEAKEKSVAALKLLDKLSDRRERSEAELSLQLTLGRTARAVKGYAAPEVADSFERAAILGREVKRVPETFSAIGGLYAFCLVRAEHHRAFEYANQLMELALKQASPSLRLDAHFALGTNMYWRGDFADSWKHLEQAFGDYQAGLRLTNIVASDTLAFALAYGASCNWHLGYPQKAYKLCADVLRRIREVDHPFTAATARLNLIITLLSLKKNVEARREIRELINISATSGFPYTEGLGHYFECWSILQEKPTEIAVRELSNILGLLQSQGAKGSLAYGSVVLGDA
jgi:tetratricopeptide (TPR) repeat protein